MADRYLLSVGVILVAALSCSPQEATNSPEKNAAPLVLLKTEA